jgi:hypothetical protein
MSVYEPKSPMKKDKKLAIKHIEEQPELTEA